MTKTKLFIAGFFIGVIIVLANVLLPIAIVLGVQALGAPIELNYKTFAGAWVILFALNMICASAKK